MEHERGLVLRDEVCHGLGGRGHRFEVVYSTRWLRRPDRLHVVEAGVVLEATDTAFDRGELGDNGEVEEGDDIAQYGLVWRKITVNSVGMKTLCEHGFAFERRMVHDGHAVIFCLYTEQDSVKFEVGAVVYRFDFRFGRYGVGI